jgi:hypothetical protein
MQRSDSPIHPDYSGVHFGAAAVLRLWLALGVCALLLFPGLRGSDPVFGWLPFWCVVAPLLDLAILRPCALASHAFLVRVRRRGRPARQARRLRRRSAPSQRLRLLLTGLFNP